MTKAQADIALLYLVIPSEDNSFEDEPTAKCRSFLHHSQTYHYQIRRRLGDL